ncbi:MAG: response regulator transcription factor [FCB group bacterium]|nr:response regulator transcription factor [FCB group bacterium]
MIKILIADDHRIVREGLKLILEEPSDISVVSEASDGFEVLNLVRKNNYDVIILDISMPGKSGLDVLKEIRKDKPKLPILILSAYPEDQYAVRVIKAGANGYLTKESAPEELITAIRRVQLGKKYISLSLAEKLATYIEADSDKPPHETLSDREYEVLRMIASGMTVSEIAEKLFLSVKTISTYRTRILEKMSMRTNSELTHYAIQKGLVE